MQSTLVTIRCILLKIDDTAILLNLYEPAQINTNPDYELGLNF